MATPLITTIVDCCSLFLYFNIATIVFSHIEFCNYKECLCTLYLIEKVEGKIMLVRRAEIKDIEKINELLLQVAMVHHYGRPDLFKANCRKYKNDELVEIVKDDNRPIFVAEDDGVVMGYAFCVITDRKDDNVLTDMKNLYIDDLCVDENMRDKHIGTVIYDYVKKYAKKIGCYNLTLNVWSCNESAQKFYERQGLKPQKTTMEMIL